MLALPLVGVAAAACALPAAIDPHATCVEDANGFATLDADSDPAVPISLAISAKGETTDAFSVVHPATAGALTDHTGTDGRYILACPQVTGKKTVQFTISRPANLTAFGAEWVQLFPKGSWHNATNEYEPFLFNDFGAKIPLAEFRPTSSGLTDDAADMPVLHVFMEVSGRGDYEVKYGNPSLVSGGKWVVVEFKSTFLRVGDPWADCTDSELAAPSYSVGSIMPLLFGGPNLNSVAHIDSVRLPSYYDVIAELSGVSVPVKVVLEIFSVHKTNYTSSALDSQCFKAGPACPQGYRVCKAEYCEMDVWAAIIDGFKAASPGMVTVLGSVDSSTMISAYDDLDVDGFYYVGVNQSIKPKPYSPFSPTSDPTRVSVAAIGTPLFDETEVDVATVFVTLASSDLGLWNPFSWYPSVPPSRWAAIVTEAADTSAIATLFDRGYGWVYLTSEEGFATKSTITPAVLAAIEATATTRRLQGRRLQASAPFWGCDDTLFECKPICMQQKGVVTSRVSDTLCEGANVMNPCACKCFHEAQWACEGPSVACKAKFGSGDLQTVGDKVCEARGASKPTFRESRLRRCEPFTEMRGSAPTAECLALWEEPEPIAAEMPTPASDFLWLDMSRAAPFALAALVLYYA
jgi:hypothetical protein